MHELMTLEIMWTATMDLLLVQSFHRHGMEEIVKVAYDMRLNPICRNEYDKITEKERSLLNCRVALSV